jgi:hypothetical protein
VAAAGRAADRFALTDGYDWAWALLPFVGRTDEERGW